MDRLVPLFTSPGFMPHGHCFLWTPALLWMYVLSDSLIGLAYYSIPVALWHFVRRRTDLPFSWVFVMFAVFIFACGTTHLMAIWNIWQPVYWLDASLKAATATASLATAVLLWPLIPKALSLPSPRQLEQANRDLRDEIAMRRRVETQLQELNQDLEQRVAARTAELEAANAELRGSQQAAMQQERLRVLGQMASGIAHDINNAILPISLYTELLLDNEQNISSKGRAGLQTMQRAIGDVSRTVARMREFYRQRDSHTPVAVETLNALVDEVMDLTRARWSDMPQQRGVVIQLSTDLMQDLPLIECVASEVRDALVNLVINAADAMPAGGRLILRTGVASLNGNEESSGVFVEVTDTGIGMNEDTRRRCLEPFFSTKGERGTGLGLAMVYGMAERHAATLDIQSKEGSGTTVRLLFPRATATALPVTKVAVSARPRPMRLLVIDDDPVVLSTLTGTLEGDGHAVVACVDGREGLASFRQGLSSGLPFAAVITDLGMPYMDGRQVATAIKEVSAQTPVLLLTGWGKQLVEEDDVPPHVDLILSKPPRLQELRDALLPYGGAAADADPPLKKPLRILVADDNPVNQVLAQRLLTERGHTVTLANNGRQAIERFREEAFDLILMDLQMPEMDGISAAAQIRTLEQSSGHHVRIVALTAHDDNDTHEHVKSAGMNGHLAKPFRRRDLLAVAEEERHEMPASEPIAGR